MSKGMFIDTRKIDKLTIELKGFEKEVGIATYHALNRTIDQTITKVGMIVPKVYAVKSQEVKDSFKGGIKKPTYSKLEASLTSRGHVLSMAHFPHSPKTPPINKNTNKVMKKYKVKVTIKKASGRKEVKSTPSPFIMTTGALSLEKTQFNIFKRLGSKRTPVTVLRTLSIPQMITNLGVEKQIQDFATEKLNERLQHEIERSMTNIGGKLR